MMTGMLHSQIGGIGTGVGTFAGAADGLYLEAYKTNYGVRRQLVVNLIEHAPDIRNALLFNQCPNGNWESYRLYGEHNKPTPADIGAAVKYRYTATIPTGTWTAVSGGGYYKDITVSGITAAMTPCVGVVQTSDVAASELMVEEFGNNIRRIETMAGKIRVYTRSDGAAPSVNIPIQLVGTV